MVRDLWCFFFFFQAEDGIRDRDVTGVQTCALPISQLEKLIRKRSAKLQRDALELGRRFYAEPAKAFAKRISIFIQRSEEHTSELQSHHDLVCRLLLEKKKRPSYRATSDALFRRSRC